MVSLGWGVGLGLGTPGVAVAGPVSVQETRGRAAGPVVRTVVVDQERSKTLGLDRQLAALPLTRGRHWVETHDPAVAVEPGVLPPGVTPRLELVFRWAGRSSGEAETEEAAPSAPQLPRLATTNPEGALAAMVAAIGDSLPAAQVAGLKAEAMPRPPRGGAERIEVTFPSPRSGVSKARQYRMARRLVSERLAAMHMLGRMDGFWPENFPPAGTLACYDAEGVGYYGSTLLHRVVEGTNLEAWVVPVCPEDIREGALQGCEGVMFPGGSGRGIANALRPEGVQIVREFVHAGGGFFGVCAGAYFAGAGLPEYTGMIDYIHHQPWAKGSTVLKLELTPEGVALMGEEFATIETRYNNGPVFLKVPASVTVLATFASPSTDRRGVVHEVMVGTPAIQSATWGKGRILTISPHPEGNSAFNAMVGRCIGWTIGRDPAGIRAREAE